MKMLFRTRFLLVAALSAALPQALLAQSALPARPVAPFPAGPMPLSLPQAISYAVQNKPALLATRLGEATARAKVGEIKSAGLPQVNVGATLSDNFKLQKSLVNFPATQTLLTQTDLNTATTGQQAVLGTQQLALPPQAFAFGLQYAGNTSASVSQLLFDGSYLIGLKAAKVNEQLAQKQTQQAEIDVVEQVSKAYYSTLVARSRLALLARNVQRLDTVLYQTNQTFKAGVAEKLDVDRLRVQRNTLVVEQQKAQRLTELSVALLKFQMGLPQQQGIRLTDSLGAAVGWPPERAACWSSRLWAAVLSWPGGVGAVGTAPTPAPPFTKSAAPRRWRSAPASTTAAPSESVS